MTAEPINAEVKAFEALLAEWKTAEARLRAFDQFIEASGRFHVRIVVDTDDATIKQIVAGFVTDPDISELLNRIRERSAQAVASARTAFHARAIMGEDE